MSRHAPRLECSQEVLDKLTALSKSRAEEARKVERARIILACLQGKENQQVAREVGASIPTVGKWRRRFARRGLEGLRDGPRSGKPPTYDAAFRNRVLALLEQPPPAGLAHWDGRAVAEKLGASVHAVWRTLRREGIYLQRLRTRPCQTGGYAAQSSFARGESISGYHSRKVARRSSFSTCVRTCKSKCAPLWLHRIGCF